MAAMSLSPAVCISFFHYPKRKSFLPSALPHIAGRKAAIRTSTCYELLQYFA